MATAPVRPLFLAIAVLSFISNGLLCVVILRNRKLLRRSYNVLMFTLAITDTLTGIFLGISPNYTLGVENVPVPSGVCGELFCRILSSDFVLWYHAKFSVAIVTVMAIERWFAIARPTKYQFVFNSRRIVIYIAIVNCCCLIALAHKIFEKHQGINDGKFVCFFKSLLKPKAVEIAFVITNGNITVFLPLIFIAATIIHLQKITKNRVTADHLVNTNRRLEMKLLRMSKFIALCLGICFIPNQFSYMLTVSLDSYEYLSKLHFSTVVISMFNSCINPWIYCLTNNFYRKELLRLVFLSKKNRVSVKPPSEANNNRGTQKRITPDTTDKTPNTSNL